MLKQNNLQSQTTEVLKTLIDRLGMSPETGSRVVGYHSEDTDPIFKGHLVTIENVLDSQTRNHALLGIINNITSDKSVEKSKLYSVLLDKYLGINVENISRSVRPIQSSIEPNAYHSLPEQHHPDQVLHECFLQPSRLFDVPPENRRYFGDDNTPTQNREWRWDGYKRDCDSAPIFRKIIQVTILSEILDEQDRDEEKSSENQLFRDGRIKALKPQLMGLRQGLLTEISLGLKTLFSQLAAQELPGDPKGLFGADPSRWDREHFPELFLIFPFVRLLGGQPSVEPSEAVAKRLTRQTNHKISSSLAWLISQFNIPLIMYSILVPMNASRSKKVGNLALAQLIIISFCLTTIFTILSLINGVTNLPFTFVRLFFRNFSVLKFLDALATIKDVSLLVGGLWMISPFLRLELFMGLVGIMVTGLVGSAVVITMSFGAIQNLAPSFVVSAIERFFSFLYAQGCGLLDLFVPCLVNPEIIPADRQQPALALPLVSLPVLQQEALRVVEQLRKVHQCQSLDEVSRAQVTECASAITSATTFHAVAQAMKTAQGVLDKTFNPTEVHVAKNLIQKLARLMGENNPPFKQQLTQEFQAITAAERGEASYQPSQLVATQFIAYLTQGTMQPGRAVEVLAEPGLTPQLFEKILALSDQQRLRPA
ncbi:MAG: hypothetical protein ACHQJ6_00495 [Candidatus Berkiellales bacterium]